ncbi:MAG TPA: hypothetical protein VFJ14_10240 [Nocardioidaceae bacterium]|nr:hypothetical protein [Nocardioidaceae bacterium]
MNEHRKVGHNSGRPRATERQQPRRSKRDAPAHADKYAKSEEDLLADALLALAAHFNGEESADA